MAWHRILLALAFLISTVLGTVTFISAPMVNTLGGEEMGMTMDAMRDEVSMPKNCARCNDDASAIMPECITPCGVSVITLPSAVAFDPVFTGFVFDRPADQEADSPIYSPDPHPPKTHLI